MPLLLLSTRGPVGMAVSEKKSVKEELTNQKRIKHTFGSGKRQRVPNASIETNNLGVSRRHVEVRILVDKLLEYMKDGRRNLLKKWMRKKEGKKMVESDCRIDKLRNGGLENHSRFHRLNGSKILERVLSERSLFLER